MVAVGKGVTVAVGCGMNRVVPGLNKHSVDRLFSSVMAWIDTSKRPAIPRHVSPGCTTYWIGVGVGMGDAVAVGGEFVGVIVLVLVRVLVELGEGAAATSGLLLRAKKTITAPINRKSVSKPRAAGRLSVIAGIRLPCTAFAGLAGFSTVPISAPHTRQRVASSDRRVPQVGQSLVGDVGVSGVIGVVYQEINPDLAHYTSLLTSCGKPDFTPMFAWSDDIFQHGILVLARKHL
jgi:hypothetical protein